MTNPRGTARKRQTDWAEFYKNGQPKEVIVIDDDTPPPSLPSSSSSSSTLNKHSSTAMPAMSSRYAAMPPPPHMSNYSSGLYQLSSIAPSQISAPTSGRVTRRTNKRLPSTELTLQGVNGAYIPRPQTNSQYSYPASSTYPSRGQPQHLATSAMYSNNGVNSLPVVPAGSSLAESSPPAKKKKKTKPEPKYAPPQTHQQYAPQTTFVNSSNLSSTSRDALSNIPPWDDKDGHYVVVPNDDFTSRYKIMRLLGQGTFGKVVECFDRVTGTHCAIKIIRAVQKYRDASKIEARVLNTLKRSDPRNEFKCLHLNECFDFRNHVCMVFDLLGQSIYDWLKDNSFCPFPPNQIQQFAKQLLTSVAFLHRLRLIHTDLKPENILLANGEYRQMPFKRSPTKTRRVLLNPEIRLIDFGSATFQDEHHSTVVSTRHYRAPEIILVEFITGEALFQTHDNLEHLAMMQAVLGPIPD
ncbi:dual specificity protein kinase kns1, partial [Podila epigama]